VQPDGSPALIHPLVDLATVDDRRDANGRRADGPAFYEAALREQAAEVGAKT